jgi:hypothetical protein
VSSSAVNGRILTYGALRFSEALSILGSVCG